VTSERAEAEPNAGVDGLLLPRAVVLIAVSIFLASLFALTIEPGPMNEAHVRPTSAQGPPRVDGAVTPTQ